jgi:dimethylhistidine N-methyltransferase
MQLNLAKQVHEVNPGVRRVQRAGYHPTIRTCAIPPYCRMASYRVIHRLEIDPAAERRALVAGLRATPPCIPPKYFYDDLGCALYGAICALPEYYLTRTESAIFSAYRVEIAQAIGTGGQFVDLGAGDCSKGESWLPFVAAKRYLAVDIAAGVIERALVRLAPAFPGVEMLGLITDFTLGLDLRRDLVELPTTFFYPGSSIGNFTPDDALIFLRAIRRNCEVPGSGLLIGVDTIKDRARLDSAYDDSLRVTAAFNRNVLNHVNRVLGSDFTASAYAHRGFYNVEARRVEMHLEAMSTQVVTLDGAPRTFDAGERIHTENSYKYAPEDFAARLELAGFRTVRCWQDAHGDFAMFHAV